MIQGALSLISRASLDEKAMALYSVGSEVCDRLGDRSRAYRYLLKGQCHLHDQQLSGRLQSAGSESMVVREYSNDLISLLLNWGDNERALFFLNQRIARAWNTTTHAGRNNRLLLPRRTGWVARAGQTIIQFWVSYGAKGEIVALVMDSQRLKSHRYDFEFKEIIDIWIKWTTATYEYKNAVDANSSVSLSEAQLQKQVI